jgi:hypothetical protein
MVYLKDVDKHGSIIVQSLFGKPCRRNTNALFTSVLDNQVSSKY